MRARAVTDDLSVHVIAGTYVVLLGLDVSPDAAKGLLGFTISRTSNGEAKPKVLGGGKYFSQLHGPASPNLSDTAPIQAFLWGDYEAQPGETYMYRVVPQYGTPGVLTPGQGVEVTITTERPEDGVHSIFFNRGVAGSQAYMRRFGDHQRWYLVDLNGKVEPCPLIKPEEVPDRTAMQWLSRGLEEAMLAFINQARGPEYSLRAAVYEFTHIPVIQAFVDAVERGVDVKIVHHAKRESIVRFKTKRDPKDGTTNWGVSTVTTWDTGKPAPKSYKNKYLEVEATKDAVCQAAEVAVAQVGLKRHDFLPAFREMLIERKNTTISHNKFIVLLHKGKAVQVWTGSTNLTGGGIFGQSNVGHVVRDAKIATKYLDYWKMLSKDPSKAEMTAWTTKHTPNLTKLPGKNSIVPIFSPRASDSMLGWYADRVPTARNSVFFTAAFTVDKRFLAHFTKQAPESNGAPYQRYILLETRAGLMRDKVAAMSKVSQNQMAWGDLLRAPRGSAQDRVFEVLTGLNEHVSYVHTKFMLVDPLSDDPLVVTGSANFSENSTTENDENMLVIRGDKRVADIFLGEFMRLFQHFRNRNQRNHLSNSAFAKSRLLATTDAWTRPHFQPGSWQCQQRLLFK